MSRHSLHQTHKLLMIAPLKAALEVREESSLLQLDFEFGGGWDVPPQRGEWVVRGAPDLTIVLSESFRIGSDDIEPLGGGSCGGLVDEVRGDGALDVGLVQDGDSTRSWPRWSDHLAAPHAGQCGAVVALF